jgi:hypothetical protein
MFSNRIVYPALSQNLLGTSVCAILSMRTGLKAATSVEDALREVPHLLVPASGI